MEKEIAVGNKMIAEFMGGKKTGCATALESGGIATEYQVRVTENTVARYYDKEGAWTDFKSLRYHASWNWLMPVVEKIGDTRVKATASYNPDLMFKVEVCNGYTKIEGTHQVIFHNASKDGMLTATYKAVIDFIQWYNEQNK